MSLPLLPTSLGGLSPFPEVFLTLRRASCPAEALVAGTAAVLFVGRMAFDAEVDADAAEGFLVRAGVAEEVAPVEGFNRRGESVEADFDGVPASLEPDEGALRDGDALEDEPGSAALDSTAMLLPQMLCSVEVLREGA